MDIDDLIAVLQQFAEQHDSKRVRVNIAMQPTWPMEAEVGQVADVENEDGTVTVLILEGEHLGYLSSEGAEAAGW